MFVVSRGRRLSSAGFFFLSFFMTGPAFHRGMQVIVVTHNGKLLELENLHSERYFHLGLYTIYLHDHSYESQVTGHDI